MIERVILVNEDDQEIGTAEKMEAHLTGQLHRAFSVLLYNMDGDMLLQQRADKKYHSAGLWSNACCSHPRPGESIKDAAKRRLLEELGVELDVNEVDKFVYRAEFENGLTEHELDYVFTGFIDRIPVGNPDEVKGLKFMKIDDLERDLRNNSERYTVWFRLIMDRLSKTKVSQ